MTCVRLTRYLYLYPKNLKNNKNDVLLTKKVSNKTSFFIIYQLIFIINSLKY